MVLQGTTSSTSAHADYVPTCSAGMFDDARYTMQCPLLSSLGPFAVLQSEAWNYVSSERVSSLGLQVVEGDLVLENEAQPEGDFLGEDADDLFSVGPDSPLDRGKKARPGLPVPHVVTAEDVQAGRFKLTDVVMPLPGVHVQYPLHSVGEERYASFFAGHGLTLQSLRGTTTSAFTVGGNYRRLIVQPKDMEWEMKQYSDATEQLIPTDIDALSRVGARHETPPGADQPQDFWALCLSFTLPVSSYATVMLFELTKQSMGFHHQRALNSLTAGQLAPQSTST
jgi:tRNA pseudouridine13 synthase